MIAVAGADDVPGVFCGGAGGEARPGGSVMGWTGEVPGALSFSGPVGAAAHLRSRGPAGADGPIHCGLGPEADPSVRSLLHRRYVRAVARAVDLLGDRPWRARNPAAVLRRLAVERLLIGREGHRTPLRRIAAESGLAPSQTLRYARALEEEVRRQFRDDVQVPLLLALARRGKEGFDARVDAGQRQSLQEAEWAALRARFAAMDRPAQVEALCRLIRLAGGDVAAVAAELQQAMEAIWRDGRTLSGAVIPGRVSPDISPIQAGGSISPPVTAA